MRLKLLLVILALFACQTIPAAAETEAADKRRLDWERQIHQLENHVERDNEFRRGRDYYKHSQSNAENLEGEAALDSALRVQKANDHTQADNEYVRGKYYYDRAQSGKADAAKQDYVKAMAYFRRAAGHGKVEASLMVGSMYSDGKGVSQDYVEAVKWYNQAARQGVEQAQLSLQTLGAAHERQQPGALQDYLRAYTRYNLMAFSGNASQPVAR